MTLMRSYNPADGSLVWEGRAATNSEIAFAIQEARQALSSWSETSLQERICYLKAFQEILRQHQPQLAETISLEVGKPLWESHSEVGAMIGKVDISIQAYHERSGEKERTHPSALSITRHKPHGVLAVLGPYNFPGHLPNGHIIPALIAGNTVVFKPSEWTPLVGEVIMQIWKEAGLPQGVLQLLQGGKEVGEVLVTHRNLDGLLFTGSWPTGRRIAEHLLVYPGKILALEMGGNNPLVIGAISDYNAAAYQTIQSAYLTSGQRCTCARRLLVPKGSSGDAFLEILAEMIQGVSVGNFKERPEPFMGPVIHKEAASSLMKEQEQLIKKGAYPLQEMRQGSEAFLTPGLIDVTAIKNRDDREIFGPLLQVIRVEDFSAAIAEANNTAFGLSAGLFSDDPDEYKLFYKHLRAGVINWNVPLTGASSASPFGGVGQSGNYRPSAYYAADYCAYPVASLESQHLTLPEKLSPGIKICRK